MPTSPVAADAPAATIATGLLLPQDRVPRAPLGTWASRLVGELEAGRRALRQPRRVAGLVAGIANNAALMAAYVGSRATAERLCKRQMTWQRRLARRSGDPAITAHAIQPWINLGRLEAVTGNWSGAVSRFARLAGYRLDGWVEVDCIRIDGSGWQAVAPSREKLEQTLDAVYVVDSLKALLMNRRFEEAAAFANGLGADRDGGLLQRADEARVVSACRLGDFRTARRVAEAAEAETGGWNRAVFRLRLAEVLACSGDMTGARGVLRPLAEVVAQVSAERKCDARLLYAFQRLSTACAEAGLHDEALALARDLHTGARATGDEVFEIESLRILAEDAPAGEREQRGAELARLEESTGYERYRRGAPLSMPDPAVARLFSLLDEFLGA
ncbi:MAG: hypothetical protein ACJ8GN_21875 [Longimicrobiaceae bacterium]